MGSGVDKNSVENTIYEWLQEDVPLAQVVQKCNGSFEVLPSNLDLTAAEIKLMQLADREYQIRSRLQVEATAYEYVIIDCPPSLNLLTLNALAAAGEEPDWLGDAACNDGEHSTRHHATNRAWRDACAAVAIGAVILGDKEKADEYKQYNTQKYTHQIRS